MAIAWPHALGARERLHAQLERQRQTEVAQHAPSITPKDEREVAADYGVVVAQPCGGDVDQSNCPSVADDKPAIFSDRHVAASSMIADPGGEFIIVADMGDTFACMSFVGYVVVTVEPTSWAAQHGVRALDELRAINGRSVTGLKTDEFEFLTRRIRPLILRFHRLHVGAPVANKVEDGRDEEKQICYNVSTATSLVTGMSRTLISSSGACRHLQNALHQSGLGVAARISPQPPKKRPQHMKPSPRLVPWRPAGVAVEAKIRQRWSNCKHHLFRRLKHSSKDAPASRLRCELSSARRTAEMLADMPDPVNLCVADTQGQAGGEVELALGHSMVDTSTSKTQLVKSSDAAETAREALANTLMSTPLQATVGLNVSLGEFAGRVGEHWWSLPASAMPAAVEAVALAQSLTQPKTSTAVRTPTLAAADADAAQPLAEQQTHPIPPPSLAEAIVSQPYAPPPLPEATAHSVACMIEASAAILPASAIQNNEFVDEKVDEAALDSWFNSLACRSDDEEDDCAPPMPLAPMVTQTPPIAAMVTSVLAASVAHPPVEIQPLVPEVPITKTSVADEQPHPASPPLASPDGAASQLPPPPPAPQGPPPLPPSVVESGVPASPFLRTQIGESANEREGEMARHPTVMGLGTQSLNVVPSPLLSSQEAFQKPGDACSIKTQPSTRDGPHGCTDGKAGCDTNYGSQSFEDGIIDGGSLPLRLDLIVGADGQSYDYAEDICFEDSPHYDFVDTIEECGGASADNMLAEDPCDGQIGSS